MSIERVKNHLARFNADGRIKEFPVSSATVELAAAAIRTAMNRVGEITGKTVEPDILDHIFSRFCIGK